MRVARDSIFFGRQGGQGQMEKVRKSTILELTEWAATRHGRRLIRVVAVIDRIGFEPQAGRTNGISDRQQRFFAGRPATEALLNRPLLQL